MLIDYIIKALERRSKKTRKTRIQDIGTKINKVWQVLASPQPPVLGLQHSSSLSTKCKPQLYHIMTRKILVPTGGECAKGGPGQPTTASKHVQERLLKWSVTE